MSKRTYFLIAGGIILATLALTLAVLPQLPSQVPVHWNAHNQIDQYGSKWTLVALLPGIMAGTICLMAVLPWLSPRRFQVDEPRHLYLALMDILLVFLAYFQVLMIVAALGRPLHLRAGITLPPVRGVNLAPGPAFIWWELTLGATIALLGAAALIASRAPRLRAAHGTIAIRALSLALALLGAATIVRSFRTA